MDRLRILFFSVAITVLFAACTDAKEAPGPSLDRESFVALLTDIRILEGAYGTDFQRIDSSVNLLPQYYQQVFEKHKVTKEIFVQNFTAYSRDPDLISSIEEEVMERLSTMQAEIQNLHIGDSTLMDSANAPVD